MFECIYLPRDEIKTVYAVDSRLDAFLISIDGEFKWRRMERFKPLEDSHVDNTRSNRMSCHRSDNSVSEANV